MKKNSKVKVGLIGNPNSGKSSLFNVLTGLRQKTSNYPGITVEHKTANYTLPSDEEVKLIDFPGLYSLYPNSSDEKLVVRILADRSHDIYPDLIVYVADVNNLERHLLLASQILDLNIPMIFAINMVDTLENQSKTLQLEKLKTFLEVPVVTISSRASTNIGKLADLIDAFIAEPNERYSRKEPIASIPHDSFTFVSVIKEQHGLHNDYQALLYAHHAEMFTHLSAADRIILAMEKHKNDFKSLPHQVEETMQRYDRFSEIARHTVKATYNGPRSWTDRIDDVLTHKFFGPIIFFTVMLFMFQAMYSFATYPMDLIEYGFGVLSNVVRSVMPVAWYTDLLVDGILAGLGGVFVFIPQIVILFLLISLLEEVGYMSRAVYMFDGLMQKFGLSGRSLVSLVSSGACAIPAIISARTIGNKKERLNTILVSPLISCSARIPVYTVLVGFVVKEQQVWGVFNSQGLAFMGLYLLGIIGALGSALLFKFILKSEGPSYLMLELPQYKTPIWKNALINVKTKATEFVVGAGKIIIAMSMLLWFLASYGPGDEIQNAETLGMTEVQSLGLTDAAAEDYIASKKIEHSYAGHVGKFIEPAIKPLGFDWKIGIALLTSFAAREVFVGTMATIYSIGSADDEMTIRDRMATQISPSTGLKVYNPATALSLLIFYVFAMQCMSTLAVTKAETGSWKWPVIQFVYMGLLAYLGSFIAFQLMS